MTYAPGLTRCREHDPRSSVEIVIHKEKPTMTEKELSSAVVGPVFLLFLLLLTFATGYILVSP